MLMCQQKGICGSDCNNRGQEMTGVDVHNTVARECVVSMET